ncbi:uncharacterized protein LOC131313421 isoform X3 [Rhododendron vialii]|uniref:uncharacterized protein LOC131313421 isoform X3 n=1 Tax=Rhododendron vialii TaxID=182163 RepID=UPI00265E9E89|nr:uncharacterized protein LOC131313421 isoform X3 [Rhododendron vialii]
MAENPKLEYSDALSPSRVLAEMDTQKISVSDQTNGLQFTNTKPDSFAVDMDRLSHLADKDKPANSRFTRGFSRKGSQQRRNEKKITPSSTDNEGDTSIESAASPRAALAASSMPEKPMVVTVGTANHPMNSPQLHHQITIMTGSIGGATTGAESRSTPKRLGSRRSPPSWTADPRRIVFFFATLSSMGTLLLIYFTLTMGKLSGDDNALEW